jgi:Ca2+-binding RTX toxin-like protein
MTTTVHLVSSRIDVVNITRDISYTFDTFFTIRTISDPGYDDFSSTITGASLEWEERWSQIFSDGIDMPGVTITYKGAVLGPDDDISFGYNNVTKSDNLKDYAVSFSDEFADSYQLFSFSQLAGGYWLSETWLEANEEINGSEFDWDFRNIWSSEYSDFGIKGQSFSSLSANGSPYVGSYQFPEDSLEPYSFFYGGNIRFADHSIFFDHAAWDDTVDFNALTAAQIVALTDGADRYHALKGDDVVTLPNLGTFVPGGYDRSQMFDAGEGFDTITGGNGNDIIAGGLNSDNITGGAGSDIFVYSEGDGSDLIKDFTPGQDKIDLRGFPAIKNLAAVLKIAYDESDSPGKPAGAALFTWLDIQQLMGPLPDGAEYNGIGLFGIRPQHLSERDFIFATATIYTKNDDNYDFNNLKAEEKSKILTGVDLYSSLEGDDEINLPNKSKYQLTDKIKWNPNLTFDAGDGNDIIIGGDGNDKISGGNGLDIFEGSPGNDTINGGAGFDIFDFKAGFAGFASGAKQTLDGGANLAVAPDLMILAGSPNDYQFKVEFGTSWETARTVITKGPLVGAPLYTFDTKNIEKLEFSGPINNNVNLGTTFDNVTVNYAGIVKNSYPQGKSPTTLTSVEQGQNWHPVAAIELGIKPTDYGTAAKYTFVNGVYNQISLHSNPVWPLHTLANDATATVLTGVVNGKLTLSISFKGSDSPPTDPLDWAFDVYNAFHVGTTALFYQKYAPLVAGLKNYIQENPLLEQIVVSGHSLGGAMVQEFLNDLLTWAGDELIVLPSVQGFAYASIGGTLGGDISSNYMVNFVHTGDVANLLNVAINGRSGPIVWINTIQAWDPVSQHLMQHYVPDMVALVDFAGTSVPFKGTSLAQTLIDGTVWHGDVKYGTEIRLAPGNNADNRITSTGDDHFVMAGNGNDTIDVTATALGPTGGSVRSDSIASNLGRAIDGGGGTKDRLIVAGKFDDYLLQDSSLFPGGKDLVLKSGEMIGTLFDVEEIHYSDGPRKLDGSVFTAQTPAPGAKTLVVSSTAQYANAGNGDMTVTGSSSGDVIYGGTGKKTINAGLGNDVVILADMASDTITIDGGAGIDVMIAGLGTHIFKVDNEGDSVSDIGGKGTVIATVNYVLSQSIANLTLMGNSLNGTGNEIDNNLLGNAKVNLLIGKGGDDTINGGAGADTLWGGEGNDTYTVDNVKDSTRENANEGIDEVLSSVTFTLESHVENLTLTGLTSINGKGNASDNIIIGNNAGNLLSGGDGEDFLMGEGGDDTIEGGSGADDLNGGGGINTLRYQDDKIGVTINLSTKQASGKDSDAAGDTISNFHNLIGGAGNDSLAGDANANRIEGGNGNDKVSGLGGKDTLDGGGGIDTLNFEYLAAGQNLTIALGALNTKTGLVAKTSTSGVLNDIDSVTNFENVTGGFGNDKLTGNAGDNTLEGSGGRDQLFGMDGNDVLGGGKGGDVLDGGKGGDVLDGGADNDTASYKTSTLLVSIDLENDTAAGGDASGDQLNNIENLIGSARNDTLSGDGNANIIEGGLGDDTLNGQSGIDTLSFVGATAAITYDLSKQGTLQTTGGAGKDLAIGFENLTGGAGADKLTGDSDANKIVGNAGNDVIVGGSGADYLEGGLGVDTLTGGADSDVFFVKWGEGADNITDFGSGIDEFVLDLAAGLGNPLSLISNGAPTNVGPSPALLYDTDDGRLFYDSGPGAAVLVAVLANKAVIDFNDFTFI